MRWGVRRTPEQLGHYKSSDRKIKSITDTWSKQDREYMNLYGDDEYTRSSSLAYRSIQYVGKLPVSFIDIEDYGEFYNVSIGTRSGEEFRGKGFASKCLKDGLKWYEEHKSEFSDKPLSWWAREENAGSNKLAISAGFDLAEIWRDPENAEEYWNHYLKR